MKKLLLITIILLLQSFPSFGNNLEGKGLICKYLNDDVESIIPNQFIKIDENGKKIPSVIGYFFNKGFVNPHFYMRENDNIELKKYEKMKFNLITTNTKIEWEIIIIGFFMNHILDRKTLSLRVINHLSGGRSNYECELIERKKVFITKMKKIREIYRNEIKGTLKKLDNKI
jgi:hypothetical protein